MRKGISLHIGLNYVDPKHYSDWDGKLDSAEYDAFDMDSILKSQGFQTASLITQEATREAVISHILKAASLLSTNDMFVITYSGHGGRLPDLDGDEDDYKDETWCLFNGEILDDELSNLWTSFKNGVRILIISDSCNSGTISWLTKPKSYLTPRYMPSEVAKATYSKNKEFYDEILKKTKEIDSSSILASVKLISGCQDYQSSYEGDFNGQFTERLKKVWNGGNFNGNYYSFYEQIKNSMPNIEEQTPNYYNIGQSNINFDNQKPFTI